MKNIFLLAFGLTSFLLSPLIVSGDGFMYRPSSSSVVSDSRKIPQIKVDWRSTTLKEKIKENLYPMTYPGINLRKTQAQQVINEAATAREFRPATVFIKIKDPSAPYGITLKTPEEILEQKLKKSAFASSRDYRNAKLIKSKVRAIRISRVVEFSDRPTMNQ